MQVKKDTIIEIVWIDSCSTYGWQTTEESHGSICEIHSIGYFLEKTKDFVCIAQSRHEKSGFRPYGELLSIPNCCIKSIKVMRGK